MKQRIRQLCKPSARFFLLAGLSLALGLLTPMLYELTLPDASRTDYPGWSLAAMVAASGGLAAALLVGSRRHERAPLPDAQAKSWQFGLRHIFAATTLVAIVIALARWLDATAAMALMVGVNLVAIGWSWRQAPPTRWRLAALLACMYLPFAWMIPFNEPFGYSSGLAINIPLGPGLFPAQLLSLVVRDVSLKDSGAVPATFVTLQIAAGAWLMARGGKLGMAYTLASLIMAAVSSFVLHALYRW